MRHSWRISAPLCLLLVLMPAAAHEDLLGTHYVSSDGSDDNDCHHADEPCLTFAHALEHSFEGDTIKVAEGVYVPTDRELAELFYAPVKLLGGYSAKDRFKTQDSDANRSYLVASRRWQTAARARGFHFLATDNSNEQIGLSVQGVAPTANCTQGSAGVFPCRNVDLLSHIPLVSFSSHPASASDLWGFVDRNDNREYVVIGLANGTAIVDITDPVNPREVGFVPGLSSLWREPTVYQYFDAASNRFRAVAYVSTEARGGSVEVIDLSNPSSATHVGQLNDMLSAHTVYIANVEYSGNTTNTSLPAFLVVAGSNAGGGALRMYSVSTPFIPALVTNPVAGYMHDSSSLIVTDARTSQCAPGHNPCEILFDFNENSVDLWDMSNKSAPVRLSSTTYPNARYVHSGWPSSDGHYLFVHDELDELRNAGQPTQIYTLDISSLTSPTLRTSYVGSTTTTDHNGYVKGDRLYVSHYRRGLVVFDVSNPNALKEVGNLDTFINPAGDTAGTDGNWGAYPFFPSGAIAVSDIDNGLFILRDHTQGLEARSGRVGFGVGNVSVDESQTEVVIPVRRVDGRQGSLSVQFATASGSALSGTDFQAASGTLTWSDGDDADKTIRIPLITDTATEGVESFSVALSGLSTPASLDGSASLTVNISDSTPAVPTATDSGHQGGGRTGPALLSTLLLLLLLARLSVSVHVRRPLRHQ